MREIVYTINNIAQALFAEAEDNILVKNKLYPSKKEKEINCNRKIPQVIISDCYN